MDAHPVSQNAWVIETFLTVLALGLALTACPWRLLPWHSPLWHPVWGSAVILTLLWSWPQLHAMPIPLQWSGACLVMMMLGWPLSVGLLTGVELWVYILKPTSLDSAISHLFWQALLPITGLLLWGALLRRWWGTRPFIYILGRGFLGTLLCMTLSNAIKAWVSPESAATSAAFANLTSSAPIEITGMARWLMAWADAVVTGMLTAIFVAYKPEWLATWSDKLYLPPPASSGQG